MLQKKSSNGSAMNKVVPYNVKKTYLLILLALGLAQVLLPSCEKDDPQPKHKNVTYNFDNWALPDTVSMENDAQNNLIDTVFFKFDGTSLNGKPSSRLIKYWIGPASRAAGSKFNGGKSVINGCCIDSEADSTSITSKNYQFINSWVGSWDVGSR